MNAPPQSLSYGAALLARSASALVAGRREVAVLLYHAVDDSGWKYAVEPAQFDLQMRHISTRLRPVSLGTVVAHASNATKLAEQSVAVTFDDGYQCFLRNVLPIAERHAVPVTLFLATDLDQPTNGRGTPRVSASDLRELAKHPLVSIESHTRSHRRLPDLEPSDLDAEIAQSMRDIEELVGVKPRYFAYPFGARSVRVEERIQAAGFSAAFGTRCDLVDVGAALMSLPRVQVDSTVSPIMFRARLTNALRYRRRAGEFIRGLAPRMPQQSKGG